MEEITQKQLKQLFYYSNGELIRRISTGRHGRHKKGTIAGGMNPDGYYRIGIKHKLYKRSRLVFCYHNGYCPEGEVDHINRVISDDRIENLREVSRQCNMRNCGTSVSNSSGVKGVCWDKQPGKWVAVIGVNGKHRNVGLYDNFHNAVCARLAAEQCLGWVNCDNNSPAYKYVKANIQENLL